MKPRPEHPMNCKSSYVSITLQIAQIEIANWKYTNTIMETRLLRKNAHISQNKFLHSHEVVIRQCEKGIFCKTAMEFFFSRIYRSHGVRNKSYNHSSVYYNLQETLHKWPLSSIRGFPCH